jgi:hypothetical protein
MISLTASGSESIPPNEERAGDIFSRLGYGIADAVADIVDNSIDATAKHVHIRFVRTANGIHSILIADDGFGMSSGELKEAMRFGSANRKSSQQLGKYGIGLKSASLSQAESVTVLTRKGGAANGRRWLLMNIKQDWQCEILNKTDVERFLKQDFGDCRVGRSGTVVIWERLEHLQALPSDVTAVLDRTKKELQVEIGLRFHRFLSSGRVRISLDEQYGLQPSSGFPVGIMALDPFDYPQSGMKDYPRVLRFKVSGRAVAAECHIWPPKSRAPGYKLGGGRVALRQGFYFYRNDRLIQAGGWNKLRADDGEPHLSLARVRIELPAQLDAMFKLDVTKSRLDPSPEFKQALLSATTSSGESFEQFIADADRAYRKQKKKDSAPFPFVPGSGVPAAARKAIGTILKEPGTAKPQQVEFKWQKLDPDEVFRVDASARVIMLNTSYRRQLAEGGGKDAPVLKVTLLFMLQDTLGKAFVTKVAEERLQRINHSLLASLKG